MKYLGGDRQLVHTASAEMDRRREAGTPTALWVLLALALAYLVAVCVLG
jgi:hypothetical protein